MSATGLFTTQKALNAALGAALRTVCRQMLDENPGPSWRLQEALKRLTVVAAAMTGEAATLQEVGFNERLLLEPLEPEPTEDLRG